jgi:hypothetical protein
MTRPGMKRIDNIVAGNGEPLAGRMGAYAELLAYPLLLARWRQRLHIGRRAWRLRLFAIVVGARTQLQADRFATCLSLGFGGGIVCLKTVLGNYYDLKALILLLGIAIAITTSLSAALEVST